MHCGDHLDVVVTVGITLDTHHRLKCLVSVVHLFTELFRAVNIDYSPSTVIICFNSEISCATFFIQYVNTALHCVCMCAGSAVGSSGMTG